MRYILIILSFSIIFNCFAKKKQFVKPDNRLVILKEEAEKKIVGKDFKILVWNIFKATKKNWEENFFDIVKKYDFVLLQESFTIPKFNKQLKRFEKSYIAHAVAFHHSLTNADSGVMTISKVTPKNNRVVVSKKNEPIIDSPKVTLIQKYNIFSGKTLLLVNVHAINFVAREHLFSQLDEIGEIISNHKGPVIIAGDFNTWKRGMIKYLNQFALKYNLTQAKFSSDKRKKFRGYPLDHFLSRGISIKNSEVLNDMNSSDHSPLSIEASFDR